MPPVPHWMSIYMKKTNDFSPSVARTAWNVFAWMYKENWRFDCTSLPKGEPQWAILTSYHTKIVQKPCSGCLQLGLADMEWNLSSTTGTYHIISAQIYLLLWKCMEWLVATLQIAVKLTDENFSKGRNSCSWSPCYIYHTLRLNDCIVDTHHRKVI